MLYNVTDPALPFEMWDPTMSPTYRWILKMQTILEPVIIALGILGNTLASHVFMSKRLRTTSCCLYLAAKCLGDTIFLIALFIVWLHRVHAPLLNTTGICQDIAVNISIFQLIVDFLARLRSVVCHCFLSDRLTYPVTIFITYSCSFTSVWLIVLVSHENYVRIARPHQVKLYCTPRRALVSILVVFLSSVIIYHFHLWTTKVLEDDNSQFMCMALARYHMLLVTINILDLVVTLVIPVMLVAMLMLATLMSVLQAIQRKKRLAESLIGHDRCDSAHFNTVEMKVAKFLTIVSLTLIFLHSPSHVIRLKMLIASFVGSSQPSNVDYSLQRLFETMYYLNFSANFVIFALAGDKFRRTLMHKCFRKFCLHYSTMTPVRMTASCSITSDIKQDVELMVVNGAFDDTSSPEDGDVVNL